MGEPLRRYLLAILMFIMHNFDVVIYAGLLFRNFRSGWDVAVYQVKEDTTDTAVLQPLLVVATKTDSIEVTLVNSVLEVIKPTAANADQVRVSCILL